MSQFKNTDLFNLYYTDSDSIFVNKDLSNIYPEWIGSELGKFKLEYILKEAIFLAPKVYGGITIENKSIIKIKGYKHKIPFNDLKNLLHKNTNLELLTTYTKLNGLSLFMKVKLLC